MVNGERRRQSVFTSMTAQKARCPSGKIADEKWRVLYVAELREIWGKRSQRQLRRKEHLANAIIIIFHQIFYWLYYLPSWVLLPSSSPFPQSPPPPPHHRYQGFFVSRHFRGLQLYAGLASVILLSLR